jgi:hypothetical protein
MPVDLVVLAPVPKLAGPLTPIPQTIAQSIGGE